ncbi:MAG TPA: hypothetical protein VFC80_06220 [Sphaerochaeta sp.]|nr:hypothetical protein [Sphaerochaeta sp.]
MKRSGILILLLLAVVLPISGGRLSLSLDVMALESCFYDTALLRTEVAFELDEEFSLRVPLSCHWERERGGPFFIEGAICLDYHFFRWPLCVSLSLAQMGVVGNHPWEEGVCVHFLNEIALAWDWYVGPALLVRPAVIIRDPNRLYEAEYEELQALFSHYPSLRFSLAVGWVFDLSQS